MIADRPSRRNFLTGASAATLGLGASALLGSSVIVSAQGVKIPIQLNWIPSADFAGFYNADAMGFYKAEGLTVEFLPGGPNMQAVEQVISGGVATAGLPTFLTTTVNAVQKKADLVVIGTVFQTSPLALISLAKTPLKTAKDLVGKRIGGTQGRKRELDAVFRINNLDPNDYRFVPVGFDPTPLVKGDIDVMSVFSTSEQTYSLTDKGIEINLAYYADLGLPTYTDPIVVSGKVLKENRKAILGFLRASIKGWEMNVRDPETAPKFLAERYAGSTKIDIARQIRVNRAQMPLTQSALTKEKGMLWLDKALIKGPIYAGLTAAGVTDLPDVDSYVDTSLLSEVYGTRNTLL
ncbi:ABC transporter substrate-binding protein [Pseudorhodoplanes sp.]|uniref:ABC transporter substrate-binding protein n=1 Tax=Pseudorhodoplanes sp. TaxID=1934341 RepID=UPI003D0AD497